jgi:hypothetical protein
MLAAAAGGVAVSALLVRSPHDSPVRLSAGQPAGGSASAGPVSGSSSSAAPPPGSAPPSAAPSEQTAAQALAQLLASSASDRGAVVSAVSDVKSCGSGLAQDAQTFQQAAASRQQLISQLAALPGVSTLPAQLVQDLNSAWQASIQADQDFAAWAGDENSGGGCTTNDSADANFEAATEPDDEATTDKQDFVGLWNPIATQYGLTTYQWNQL